MVIDDQGPGGVLLRRKLVLHALLVEGFEQLFTLGDALFKLVAHSIELGYVLVHRVDFLTDSLFVDALSDGLFSNWLCSGHLFVGRHSDFLYM